MKPICLYHSPCQDGFTAAWACWKAHPDWEFYPAKHGDPPPDVTSREVFMVDFSYKRPVILEMAKTATKIHIIDHHKTAEQDLVDLPENVNVVFFMEHSGAYLSWKYFHPDEKVPELLLRVEDRDLWRFKFPDTKGITAYLFSQDYDFTVWDWLMRLSEDGYDRLEIEGYGNSILKKQDKDIQELLVNKFKIVIGGHEVWACNLPYTFSSDAGNILAQGEPFGSTFYLDGGFAYFSLRSTEEGIDVSEIAKSYGGGGHKHAAGFKVRSPLIDWKVL